jgi:hypothetical protein
VTYDARVRTSLLLVLIVAACGDDGSTMLIVDAMPDAPPIDSAPTCGAPSMMCGASCLDVSSDEENCGACGEICGGGEACIASACDCPDPFVPATLTAGGFDQIMAVGQGITIAINPNLGTGINPFIVGYDAATPDDMDIDLSTVTLGEAPFVGAGYGFDIGTMAIDASYVATAGTLRITERCATHVEGTLTNATFQGISGGFTNPTLDPEGCTFTVATVTFEMGETPCQ